MRNYIIILFTLTLTYCTSKVEIKSIRDFEIPYISGGNRNFNCCVINDEQYYYYTDKLVNKSLFIRNVESNKLELTVPLDNIFEQYPRQEYDMTTEGICIHSFDSIYFLANEDKAILLINDKGYINKTYKITKDLYPEQIPYVLQSFGNAPLIEVDNNEFICRTTRIINIGSKEGRLAFYNLPTIGKVELGEDTTDIINLNVFFPNDVRKDGNDYQDVWVLYTVNNNKEIIYSFRFTPYIYKLNNNNNNNELDSFVINSKYFSQKEIKPVDSVAYFKDTYAYVKEYNAKTPAYLKIIFNPFQNSYYRIARHTKKYKNNDGTLNKADNWSIIFLDNDFNILDEVPFLNDSIYSLMVFIPTKKGFIIGKKQSDEDKENDKLRLCEFEVKL